MPVSELTCILSSAYKKEKVSEHPPSKLCTLRPWSLNHGYYIRLFTCPQGGFWCFLLSFFVESSVTTHMCPICQATLRYRDSRPRIRRKEGGLKDQLIIRRFYCKNCHSYHNELPDCLVPYKHYETEVISGVLDGVVQPEDLDSEDYPSCATMLRWLQWFCENLERINGYLRTIREFLLGYNEERISLGSLLDSFRNQYQNWLEIILRQIYNSGGFLVPICW